MEKIETSLAPPPEQVVREPISRWDLALESVSLQYTKTKQKIEEPSDVEQTKSCCCAATTTRKTQNTSIERRTHAKNQHPSPSPSPPIQKDTISAEILEQISFSELLTISRCSHQKHQSAEIFDPKWTVGTTLLDLNQLEELGAMHIGVEQLENETIRVSTMAKYKYVENRTEIHQNTSIIGQNLELIEDCRKETSQFGIEKLNKKWKKSIKTIVHGQPEDGSYLAEYKRADDIGNEFIEQKIHKVGDNIEFILNGTEMMFKRFWVVSGFVGTIEAKTLNIDGESCQAIFTCGRKRKSVLNGKEVEVVQINRIILNPNGASDISKSIFLTTGHLVRHKFRAYGCSLIMHLNPLLDIPPENVNIDLGADGARWIFTTFSMYLKSREERVKDIQEYFSDQPEIKDLLKDYILALIYAKPDNVVEYSIDYFKKFETDTE